MRAVLCRRYGPPEVLEVAETPPPVAGPGEVLVRVKAAAINALDGHLLRGRPYIMRLLFGLRRPRSPVWGRDVAGEVVATGSGVTRFAPGDGVFGTCRGAFAELATAREAALAPKPARASFEQAAALGVAALTALQGLRDRGGLRADQRVLVHGAGGGVGSFAVQIAKALGAEVTAVSRHPEVARSLGADRVLDATRAEFTATDERWNLIFDCHADRPLRACRAALAPGGTYLVAGGPFTGILPLLARSVAMAALSARGDRKLRSFLAKVDGADLRTLAGMVDDGKLVPLVELAGGLDQVPAAIRRMQEGRLRGKLVVVP